MIVPTCTTLSFPSRTMRRAVLIALYGATAIPVAFAQTAPTEAKKMTPR